MSAIAPALRPEAAARLEAEATGIAARRPPREQLVLFRRGPMQLCYENPDGTWAYNERGMDYLDALYGPQREWESLDPEDEADGYYPRCLRVTYWIVRVESSAGYGPAEGIYIGFREGLFGAGNPDLVIRDRDSHGSSRHIGPAAVIEVEALELHVEEEE